MKRRIDMPQDAALPRRIHSRQGVGVVAHVLQGRELEILRIRVEQSTLILIDKGIKTVRAERGATVRAHPGQAIVMRGNQTVDFSNCAASDGYYEARWLVFDHALLDDPYYRGRAAQVEPPDHRDSPVRLLGHVHGNLSEAFDRVEQSLNSEACIPDTIARQRTLEVMHWLLEMGVVLRGSPVESNVSVKIRAMIAGSLDGDWTAGRVASKLAVSEATLRRRLALEGTSLTELLAESRMSTALTLLQATTQPVSEIALSVGYESASRFAVRFRQRFGFAPTAVRGHERPN